MMININTNLFTADAKQYRCKACKVERRFRRKDNLIRHIRNTHRDLEPEMASVWNQAPIADACFEVSAIATLAAFTYSPLTRIKCNRRFYKICHCKHCDLILKKTVFQLLFHALLILSIFRLK